MDSYYGSNRDHSGHYVPNHYINEDLSHFQSNVYGYYDTAEDYIEFESIKAMPLIYFHSYSDEKYNYLENSNKIILPSTILSKISTFNGVNYPLMFKIDGIDDLLGVADFIPDIDVIYVPFKIYNKLIINEIGDVYIDVNLKLYNLPIARGTKAILQVHDAKFIEIEDYKYYLEHHLQKNYSILQENTTIEIEPHPLLNYPDGKLLKINIINTEPENVILITDTDLAIEFQEPVNYQEYLNDKERKIEIEKGKQENNDEIMFSYWHKKNEDSMKKFGYPAVPVEITKNKQIRFFLNFNFKKITS
jgi:hypothetical protein